MFKNGRVEIIANDQGNRITPSYVAFTADGERLVFKLVDKNSKPHVQVETSQGEKTFAAEEISAMVLVKMKETAWKEGHSRRRHCACLLLLCTGDTHLRGEDFDQRVMDHFIKLYKKKKGKDLRKDVRAVQKLRREVEKAKRALSAAHQVCHC